MSDQLLSRYAAAWNAHDPDACAACFAPDGVREWRVLAPPHVPGAPYPRFAGRAAIAASIGDFLEAVPDLVVEVPEAAQGSDGRLWIEWRGYGTHEGDWGPWPARGEPVDFVGVSIYRMGRDGFVEERVYWDCLLMMGALTLT